MQESQDQPNVSKSYSKGKTSWGLTYLVPLGMATFRVGCRIEICLQRLRHLIGKPLPCFQALLSQEGDPTCAQVHFDMDSYPIGVDNHASRCMVNAPHLLEDLVLAPQGRQVNGIAAGVAIEGTGTYVMRLEDNKGNTHKIKVPNSLYIPKLR